MNRPIAWRVRRAAGLALAALLLIASPGPDGAGAAGRLPGAGAIVHDPTAYLQHVRNVQSALFAEGQRAQQLQQQWQSMLLQARQHETMLRQLARLRTEDLLPVRSMTAEGLQRVTEYLYRLDRLGGSLEALRVEAVRTRDAHALSGLTWPEYVEREQALARQRLDRQREVFSDARRTMSRVEADFAEVRALQSRIPHTEGSHQSLQMLNQQISLLIAQNAAAQSQLAQRDARDAHDAALAEAMAARGRRARELELHAADERSRLAIESAARVRAQAVEAIEARRLGR